MKRENYADSYSVVCQLKCKLTT